VRLRRGLRRTIQSTSPYLRWELARAGARMRPRVPRVSWMNATLLDDRQVRESLAEVRRCGLTPHKTAAKNWDALSALDLVLREASAHARILEVGATPYSVSLPWLYLFGYRNLMGIDLDYGAPMRRGPICYEPGDLTRTRFPDASFDIILSLSVIEHGVDVDAYLAEMSRILMPGGTLVTSTDYWPEAIDTRGEVAFGVPVRIFTRRDITRALQSASARGLEPTEPIALDARDRVVEWLGLRFTFICFALRKEGFGSATRAAARKVNFA
jgi:SAM-dependent methyltransferase